MIRPFFLFIFSFILFAVAQPDISKAASLIVACSGYALLWRALFYVQGTSKRFWMSFCWFSLGSLCHLSWFFSDKYVGSGILIFLLFLISALGLFFALFSLLIPAPSKLKLRDMLGLSGLWVMIEWVRLFFLSGYTWDPVGLALTASLPSMQLISLFGIYGLSFYVIFTNLLLLKAEVSKIFRFAFFTAALAPYLFGASALIYHHSHMQKENPKELKVLLIQTALSPEEKIPFDPSVEPLSPLSQCELILSLMRPYYQSEIDLILFSEANLPYGAHMQLYSQTEMKELFTRWGFSLPQNYFRTERVSNALFSQALSDLFSSDVIMGLEDKEGRSAYNAAFFFRPLGPAWARYEKRVLVPLGEYIPFSFCKKFLAGYGIFDSFERGKSAKLFSGKVPIGVSICYEETFSNLMRESRLAGAQLFVNLTNDAWYPDSRLATVHYLHGRLRSVEGIPLVRSCNTGVTCAINSLGETVSELDEKPGALYVSLSSYHYQTLYSLWGDLGILIPSACFLFFFIYNRVAFLRKKKL